jgi:ElaA protein
MSETQISIEWKFVAFSALTLTELYDVLQLRSEVFVVEQACVFQDMDGYDTHAMHLLGRQRGLLVAYARCLFAGQKYAESSIGRVVTRASHRGGGLGHVLMREAIARVGRTGGTRAAQPLRLDAQAHLENFYRQHGFEPNGEPYVEDGIPHIEMLRP